MSNPSLVIATELTTWADRLDAQGRLPQLVRRLILFTIDRVSAITFPAGEGVQKPGWDGVVATQTGNAFVPAGVSVWELGVNRDPRAKADEDYLKRTRNPLYLKPSDTTFAFVTPRRWPRKEQWAAAKQKERVWREVRVYDADDIEAWLEQAPAVHAWITGHINGWAGSAQSLESYWTNWSAETDPPFTPGLVIGGRDEAVSQIVQRLIGPAATFGLRADSPDEAVAFLASCIQQLSETDREAWLSRALVCSDIVTWRWAVTTKAPLLLVPLFEGAEVGSASRAGHHIFIPLGRESPGLVETIVLPRLRRDAARDALLAMGLPKERAENIATVARRSLLAARRRLSLNPGVREPLWARPEEASEVLPLMLAGSWDEDYAGDKEILATLAGHSYEEVQRTLVRWSSQSDPPIRRIGAKWILASKEDSWALLSRFLTPTDLEHFDEVIMRVFGTVDPALDLPPDERWAASLRGKEAPYSDLHRQGLAETLAIAGARNEQPPLATGDISSVHADQIVRRLLTSANADRTGRLWSSLADVLPLLAEADPDAFLEATDAGLSGDGPVLANLFTDGAEVPAFLVNSPHTNLLWALETLAWSRDYLGRVTLLLGRLARIDPGGKLANRPDRSLLAIYRLWHPQTAAPLDQRLQILDTLSQREPEIAWRLLIALVPGHHDATDSIQAPRWRDWKPDVDPNTLTSDLGRAVDEVVNRLLVAVDADGKRWRDTIQILDRLSTGQVDMVIDQLLSVDARLGQSDRVAVWHALRAVVSHQRRFSDANWAMPKDQVDRLAEVYSGFAPLDLIEQFAWPFADNPDLLQVVGEDWKQYRQAIEETRLEALQAVYGAEGFPAIVRLAAAVRQPGQVGYVFGTSRLSEPDESAVFALLDSPDVPMRLLARGYIVARFESSGWDWANAVLADAATWSPEQRAEFLTGLPTSGHTWDWAAQLGSVTEREYWTRVPLWGVEEPREASRAAAKLIEYGRPDAATELLALYVHESSNMLDPSIVIDTLERLLAKPSADQQPPRVQPHSIFRLFDFLADSPATDNSRLARLEWAYLPLLDGGARSARVLHREMSRDPAFFVGVVEQVFRGDGEESEETTPEAVSRAERGYTLLASWRLAPGHRNGMAIDEAALNAWVDEARRRLSTSGRGPIGDELIGHILAHVPTDEDGAWPNPVVRNLIERLASEQIELGLEVELNNSRGFTSRGPTDGGSEERELVKRYESYARTVRDQWPRTAAMLRRIARSYAGDAQRHDADAELREDLWR